MTPAAITAVAFLVATLLTPFVIRRLHAGYERRVDEAVGKLARVLLADPDTRHFGYPLARKAGVGSGVVYTALDRMLTQGLVECRWETDAVGRPARRWYRLTDTGRALLPHWEAS